MAAVFPEPGLRPSRPKLAILSEIHVHGGMTPPGDIRCFKHLGGLRRFLHRITPAVLFARPLALESGGLGFSPPPNGRLVRAGDSNEASGTCALHGASTRCLRRPVLAWHAMTTIARLCCELGSLVPANPVTPRSKRWYSQPIRLVAARLTWSRLDQRYATSIAHLGLGRHLAGTPTIQESFMQTGYSGAHRHLQLSRDDEGVLVAESNRNGGWFIMNAERHTEFVDALHRSGQDRSGSPMDSPLRLSDYAGAQTSNWDCNQE